PRFVSLVNDASKTVSKFAHSPAVKNVGEAAVVIPFLLSVFLLAQLLVAGVPLSNFLMYLFILLMQLLGVKKFTKPWGVVYDSSTKRALPFARVEILN